MNLLHLDLNFDSDLTLKSEAESDLLLSLLDFSDLSDFPFRAGFVQGHEAVELRIEPADALKGAIEQGLGGQGGAAQRRRKLRDAFFRVFHVNRSATAPARRSCTCSSGTRLGLA